MADVKSGSRSAAGYAARTFFQGLIALLPIVITAYLLALLIWWLETTVGGLLTIVLASPEQVEQAIEEGRDPPILRYVRGMGVGVAVVLIFLFGLLLKMYLVKRLYAYAEQVMAHIPVVKSIYGATKDFLSYFWAAQERGMSQVVLVRLPGTNKKVLGLMTRETFDDMPAPFREGDDTVAVYLPMSYQIGGYTLILPRDQVELVDMPIEDGLRFALTAGISEKRKEGPELDAAEKRSDGADAAAK